MIHIEIEVTDMLEEDDCRSGDSMAGSKSGIDGMSGGNAAQ